MGYNVSFDKQIEDSKSFCAREKLLLWLFVIVPFACFIANYSAYYIPTFNVLSSLFAVMMFLIIGFSLRDSYYSRIAFVYFLICGFAWCSPLVAHLESPSVKLLHELMFACCFLALNNDSKFWIYDKFIKILAIILGLGIIEFIASSFGFVQIIGETVRPNSTNTITYYQTYFNILPYYYTTGAARFQSIAEEPGLVGTLCFFILATIDIQKYKIQTIIFWIAGILTMSLAFYVLIVLWGLTKLRTFSLKYIIIALFVIGLTSYVFKEQINNVIIERINEDYSDGSLDNRNSEEVSRIFEKTFENPFTFFFGIGVRTFYSMDTGNSAGIKKMVVQYGVVIILISIVSFCSVYFKIRGKNWNAIYLLLLFIFSLYQRYDLNLSTNIIVIFGSSCVPYLNSKLKKR